jgi:hypothetical protein
MKRILLLAVVVLIAASVPAWSAYKYNWVEDFEPAAVVTGPLSPLPIHTLGQDQWQVADNPSYTDEKSLDIVAGAGPDGSQAAVQPSGHAANIRDVRNLNSNNVTYYRGYAKYWVFDPGFTGATGGADGRVGLYGAAGENNIGKMATAQIQDASTRDPNYWYAQWSYSVGKMDGATAVGNGAGYTFTQGLPAPRVWGAWSYVMITWNFTYTTPKVPTSGGSGVIKWYINQSSASPNLTLNLDSTSARWANFHEVQGLFLGSGMTTVTNGKPVAYDNVELHADAMPEPSSLLALGTGMIGLLGLIRRRK